MIGDTSIARMPSAMPATDRRSMMSASSVSARDTPGRLASPHRECLGRVGDGTGNVSGLRYGERPSAQALGVDCSSSPR
jgi:hypothetical protein